RAAQVIQRRMRVSFVGVKGQRMAYGGGGRSARRRPGQGDRSWPALRRRFYRRPPQPRSAAPLTASPPQRKVNEPAGPAPPAAAPVARARLPMLTKRIIPCLDVKDGRVVKGVHFLNLRDAGDPVEVARRYEEQGADELVFLDISATHEGREILHDVVRSVA